MGTKKCPMCNKDIVFTGNRAKYCSSQCRNIAKKARDRVYRQNRRLEGFLRCCNRCNIAYDAASTGNKRYCQKCVEITDDKPLLRECLHSGCDVVISIKKKRCSKHQKEFHEARKVKNNKKLKEENETILEQAKEKGVTKDDYKIPSRFLNRGKIHYYGYSDKL